MTDLDAQARMTAVYEYLEYWVPGWTQEALNALVELLDDVNFAAYTEGYNDCMAGNRHEAGNATT